MKRCPVNKCLEVIESDKVVCLRHWKLVPRALQVSIYKWFRQSPGSAEHVTAIQSAVDALNKLEAENQDGEDDAA